MTQRETRQSAPAWGLIGGAALLQAGLHAASFTSYGYFRDELYYLACADHPAAGYVDQPPLSILVLGAWRGVFGDSLASLHVLPLIAGLATVVLVGLLARRFGGESTAQGLAALAAACAPIWLAMSRYYSMNAFDVLFWAVAASLLAKILEADVEPGRRAGATRLWLALGVVLGLGLENKISVLWLGFGFFLGLVLTRERRWLAMPGPWLAGLLAALLFLPHVLWQVTNGWPMLEFMRNATRAKYKAFPLSSFVREELLHFNLVAAPLWVAGLLWLLVAKDGRRFRAFGIVFLATLALLVANGNAKPEYLSPAFAPLLAAGGVAFERLLRQGRSVRLAWAFAAALVLNAAVVVPFVLPLLPVERFVGYAKALGVEPSTSEKKAIGALPQHYADMFGWPEMAEAVASVWRSLPEADRAHTAVYVYNYGEAGAVDFFGRRLGLPPALCAHNNYFLWGTRGQKPEVFLVYGGPREGPARVFASVEKGGVFTHPYVMPYESGRTIWICRGLKIPLEEIWSGEKNFS
ncbi:MAG: glycosyltransferase family 39 protein [Thermoanaerobaculia bacterium]